MAGYSGTPLPQKFGIKEGHRIKVIGAPNDFSETLGKLPPGAEISRSRAQGRFDVVLCFVTDQASLEKQFAGLVKQLEIDGGLWIAWPKAASGVRTNVNENTVRAVALAAGLVDNKVCAIDSTWSGLRCVVRLKDRPKAIKSDWAIAEELAVALSNSRPAKDAFDALPRLHQKEWNSYVAEAKRPQTRHKRAEETVRRLVKEK